jgi:hypothetical protein
MIKGVIYDIKTKLGKKFAVCGTEPEYVLKESSHPGGYKRKIQYGRIGGLLNKNIAVKMELPCL